MDIKESLKKYLKSYAELKAIHKGQCEFGIASEKWQAPYQTIFKISDPRDNKRLGVYAPRFQINNFSPDPKQAEQMAQLTYEALDGFFGTLGGTGGKKVITGLYQDSNDDYENDTKLYNCIVDVKIQYRN
jgi:hypothetical protein